MQIGQFIVGDSVGRLVGALLLVSVEGVVQDANAPAERLYGCSRAELLESDLSAIRSAPDGSAHGTEDWDRLGEAAHEEEHRRFDGTPFTAEVKAVRVGDGIDDAWLVSVCDVTPRRQADAELRASEARYRAVFESAPDGVWLLSMNGDVLAVNQAMAQMHGYSVDEMLTMDVARLDTPESARLAPERLQRILGGELLKFESDHFDKSGATIPFEVSASLATVGDEQFVVGFDRNIAERRRSEQLLRVYAGLLEASPAAITVHTPEGQFVYANERAVEMHGYNREEFLALSLRELDVPEDAARMAERSEQTSAKGENSFEVAHFRKDGSVLPLAVSTRVALWDGEEVILSVATDISDSKRAENLLGARVRLAEYAANHTLDETIRKAIDEIEAITESRVGFFHLIGDDQTSLLLQAWSTSTLAEYCTAESPTSHYPISEAGVWVDCVREGKPLIHNDYASLAGRKGLPDGHAALVRELTVPVYRGDAVRAVLGVGNKPRDYDDRDLDAAVLMADLTLELVQTKRVEEALRDREGWLNESQRVAELGHYIYDIEQDSWTGSSALGQVLGVDAAEPHDFSDWLEIVHPDDRERLSSYFRDKVLGERIPFDLEYRIVRPSDAVERWVHGLGKVEYHQDGHPLAMFGIIQDITARKQSELELELRGARLEVLVEEREDHLDRLARSLTSVIQVVSEVVEIRDPHTAGHQRRVSELSAAIGQEMGMPAEEVEEIRVAALLHDVGKMSVPAEILSKPGQLSTLEFEIIKGHAEAGYRILTSANIEGTVAEIVYQHQERCDGSGYPRGLREDELLVGTKVIMVADVVEAMSSHRPYRPAMGMEVALAEIARGQGQQYDDTVSQACMRVFEKGFTFSEV